jgi:transposase
MATFVLGIDVSKAKLDVALESSQQVTQAVFSNEPPGYRKLLRWMKKHAAGQAVHVCLEATGLYSYPLAEALHTAGYPVSLVNPVRIAAYAKSHLRRNKTDKLDAKLIADFCQRQNPPLWTPPGPAFSKLHALVRYLEALQDMKQAEQNRLGSGVRDPFVVNSLRTHITFLDEQMDEIKRQIGDHIDQHPELKEQKELLTSILGLGDLTAYRLLGEIPNLRGFENTRQLDAYAGLNPQHNQSGKQRGYTSISKTGNVHLRRALYMPALVARKHNPIIRDFCERLERNGKTPKQATVAAMRKLLHLAYGVLKNRRPFDPTLAWRPPSASIAS